ncbi:uncharacterized protein VICG_01954 [Vittaforma corneae ATCC 50505]|uniref:Calcineurin subunit B n=1 Tax=Vittaforma corneae (strain ATCC 50505) TaxID=993615 RepID=L2GKF8_VITCO|nr:uncharacterized protein VICG_01954 [Vittaforma corneae ATCC 50505]ELA40995.1 hypothetical protein VICG_01954 [Vittaforma corneae ATCC 50505]
MFRSSSQMSLWHVNTLCEEEIEELEKNTIFTALEIESLYERFKYLDRSNTGFLTFAEFQMIPEFYSNPFSKLLINCLESRNSFEKVSFASYLEFLELFHMKTPKEERISFLFNLFDFDGDKSLSRKDLSQVLYLMTKKEDEAKIDEVLNAFDRGKKGYLSYADFTTFYESDPSFEKNMIIDFDENIKVEEEGFWQTMWLAKDKHSKKD